MRKLSFEGLNDIHKIQEITFATFPIVCSEAAMKNETFANGYNAHMRIKECMLSGKEPSEKDYDVCLESYDKAYEEDKVPEAAGNMLWWLLQTEYYVLNQQIYEGAEQLIYNDISGIEFLRRCYLKSFEFDDIEEDSKDEENEEFINDIEEMVQDLLKVLQAGGLSNLAYYYLAIRYAYGIVRNELSTEMNQAIGNEMLWSFSELGNAYATNFLRGMISFTRPNL